MTSCRWQFVRATTIGFLLSLVAASGCALFSSPDSSIARINSATGEHDSPVGPTINVVHLEVAVLTQPVNDRRVRTLVWEELDESGLMDPEQRKALNESGIRVGVSGGNLSWPLESLLSAGTQPQHSDVVTDDFPISDRIRSADSLKKKSRFGTIVSLLQDGRTRINLRGPVETIVVPTATSGSEASQTFKTARTILEVSVRDQRDAWVELEFLPQIHHGNKTSRYTVGDRGEQLPQRQNHYPLYEQQFRLKLHRDEVAVVGRLAGQDHAGDVLFLDDENPSAAEKLVVVRLVDVEQVVGQSLGGIAAYRRN